VPASATAMTASMQSLGTTTVTLGAKGLTNRRFPPSPWQAMPQFAVTIAPMA
jgi:hypothetical protein